MNSNFPEIGIYGLSCRLCSTYHIETKSRCGGCKSEYRMSAGCPFIAYAVKKREIEFYWDCEESETYEKWKNYRRSGEKADSFKCYQKLEDNIDFIKKMEYMHLKKSRLSVRKLLKEILKEFNEGRSKSYYCIAVTVMGINELE